MKLMRKKTKGKKKRGRKGTRRKRGECHREKKSPATCVSGQLNKQYEAKLYNSRTL